MSDSDPSYRTIRHSTISRDPSLKEVILGAGFTLYAYEVAPYFVVSVVPPLPYSIATKVNDAPYEGETSAAYGTRNGKLGGVARAHGHAGGLSHKALRTYGGIEQSVMCWHVDRLSGLLRFIEVVRDTIREQGMDAARAQEIYCTKLTNDLVEAEQAEPFNPSTALGRIYSEALHSDDRLIATDPRIISLRAKYPRIQKEAT